MKKIRKSFRLPAKILKTLVKDYAHNPSRLVIDTLAILSRCGILLILYWYVFNLSGGVINGTTFVFVAWSIFFYFSFFLLRLLDLSKIIMQDVQSGNVEVLFSKPISYLAYRMWWQVGSGVYSFVVVTIIAGIALFFIVGLPATMLTSFFVLTLLLTFILGIVLTLLLYSMVGLLAFWIEDINPVFWIANKTVMILGGSYLPVALFPPLMKKIAIYTPFGASQFVTHAVYESWQTNWYQLVGIQLFWIILFGFGVYFMFKRVRQKVSVNGG